MPDAEAAADGTPLLDMRAFRAMAAECGWTVSEFAAFYTDGAGQELAGLRAAAGRDDLAEVRRLAHGACGSSATACVPGMATAFQRVEQAAAAGHRGETARLLAEAEVQLERVLALLADGPPWA